MQQLSKEANKMTGSNKLTKKDYLKTALRAFFLQNGFNYSNYQGIGYANVIYPALKNILAVIKGLISSFRR